MWELECQPPPSKFSKCRFSGIWYPWYLVSWYLKSLDFRKEEGCSEEKCFKNSMLNLYNSGFDLPYHNIALVHQMCNIVAI